MAVFVAADSIAASIANLGASSAKSRLCEFLIGLRALKLAGDDEVGVAESVEPFMQALFEYTLCESAGATSTWDGPKFFNPFGSQAGFKSPKFQSNGPANTLHGWATQANAPFDIKTTSPKAIARRVVSTDNLRKFFLVGNNVSDRPALTDAAVWFYRFENVARSEGSEPSPEELEADFIEAAGLSASDIDALFRRHVPVLGSSDETNG